MVRKYSQQREEHRDDKAPVCDEHDGEVTVFVQQKKEGRESCDPCIADEFSVFKRGEIIWMILLRCLQ